MLTLVCGNTHRHKDHIDYRHNHDDATFSQLGQFEAGEWYAKRSLEKDIVIATNNDHVFNAIRISVLREVLKPEDVTILFYRYDIDQVDGPRMHKGGMIDYWPDGFFDQWDKALAILAGFSE